MSEPTAEPTEGETVEVDVNPETNRPYKPSDFVYMSHPAIAGPAAGPVTYEAFDVVWQHKGWVLEAPEVAQEQAEQQIRDQEQALAAKPEDVDGLDQQSLETLAIAWEVDPTTYYEFEGSTATGNVDLEGLREEVRTKIAGDNPTPA